MTANSFCLLLRSELVIQHIALGKSLDFLSFHSQSKERREWVKGRHCVWVFCRMHSNSFGISKINCHRNISCRWSTLVAGCCLLPRKQILTFLFFSAVASSAAFWYLWDTGRRKKKQNKSFKLEYWMIMKTAEISLPPRTLCTYQTYQIRPKAGQNSSE